MGPLALLDLPLEEQLRHVGIMTALDEEAQAVAEPEGDSINWLEHRGGGSGVDALSAFRIEEDG